MTPLCMHVPTGTGLPNVLYVPQAPPSVKCVLIDVIATSVNDSKIK